MCGSRKRTPGSGMAGTSFRCLPRPNDITGVGRQRARAAQLLSGNHYRRRAGSTTRFFTYTLLAPARLFLNLSHRPNDSTAGVYCVRSRIIYYRRHRRRATGAAAAAAEGPYSARASQLCVQHALAQTVQIFVFDKNLRIKRKPHRR